MPDAKSSTVVVQRGVYTVARKTVDTEGNTIRETPRRNGGKTSPAALLSSVLSIRRQTNRCATRNCFPPYHRMCFSTVSERRWASTGRTSPPSLRRCGKARWISASSAARTCKSVCFAPSIPTTISLHSRRMAGAPETPTQPPVIWCGL